MHVGEDPVGVSIELPLNRQLGRRGDVAGAAAGRQFQIARWAVHAIVGGVTPEGVASNGDEQVFARQQLKGRVYVDDVGRPDDARVVEVTGLEEERVERAKRTAAVL